MIDWKAVDWKARAAAFAKEAEAERIRLLGTEASEASCSRCGCLVDPDRLLCAKCSIDVDAEQAARDAALKAGTGYAPVHDRSQYDDDGRE